jgi:hypothetical protein
VLVQPGTYYENINFNGHNIVLGSLFLTTGDMSYISTTIIDGNSSGTVVTYESGEDSTTAITGFTIQNGFKSSGNGGGIYCSNVSPCIVRNIIRNNTCVNANGGGIYCSYGSPTIVQNIITDNNCADGGGGIMLHNSNSNIISNEISHNHADGGAGLVISGSSNFVLRENVINLNIAAGMGGGISCGSEGNIIGNLIISNTALSAGGINCVNTNPVIINNTIAYNRADDFQGGMFCWNSDPTIINTIFWADSAISGQNEIGLNNSNPIIVFCNIQDTLWPGIGNININPLFRDPDNGDFHLMSIACGDSADSPCIDAGDPNILDSLLDCSWGLGGLRSDMGAYGGGDSATVDIIDNDFSLPNEITLLQNYPNPFNSGTTIRYFVVKPDRVTLTVYDLLGREVQTLADEYMQAGFHTSTFDATDLPSGMYFYRLRVGEAVQTRPMVLLR